MTRCLAVVILIIAVGSISKVYSGELRELFTWTRIDYAWPRVGTVISRSVSYSASSKGQNVVKNDESPGDVIIFEGSTNGDTPSGSSAPLTDTSSGVNNNNNGNGMVSANNIDYRYINNIPMGANVWQDKLFITVPRRRLGVPSTLNYVPLNSQNRHNVPLIPYPNWSSNLYQPGNPENFVSVYRIAVDTCDRLWIVDTGIVETLGNRTTVKPHELIIMNLQTDEIISRHTFPDNVITPATVLAFLAVDVNKENCEDAYAYFPDLAGYGLVVFSLSQNRFWRVAHNYFYLEPLAGEFFIAGHNFQWNDGVFSVELTDIKPDGFRDMYFHSMAGTHMYRVSTRILRNETLATRSYHDDNFEMVGDRGPNSQTSAADIHKRSGVMFLAMVNQNAVGCWNTNDQLSSLSVIQKDDNRMIYPCDVKVSGDNVYILTNTMPEFLYGNLDYNQTNFRIWSNSIDGAVRGTKCQRRTRRG